MTNTTPAAGLILALDLGKYKSVACLYDGDPATARFVTLTTDREHLARLFTQHRPAIVVIEACTLAGWVSDLCEELRLPCRVANTASEAWKFKHAKRKTDQDDALRLAQLQALGQLPTVTVPDGATRPWRALIAHRQVLVGRRVALPNRIRALLVGQGLAAPRGAKAWTVLGLEGIAPHARPLTDGGDDELWRGLLHAALEELAPARARGDDAEAQLDALAQRRHAVHVLETLPGVGPRTAETVAAFVGDPHRFDNAKQVSADAGLVPRPFQSGASDRRGRLPRRGPALLRKLLVECAWVMRRYNGWARSVYQRLTRGGTARQKQAIVALARKLLVRCWAMLRDDTPWREPTPTAAGSATAARHRLGRPREESRSRTRDLPRASSQLGRST